jgi:hypothetical protein
LFKYNPTASIEKRNLLKYANNIDNNVVSKTAEYKHPSILRCPGKYYSKGVTR